MSRVYILGPMRGHKYYNFGAFLEMARKLCKGGFVVVSPAQIEMEEGRNPYTFPEDFDWNGYPEGATPEYIIGRDIKALLTCDAYIALDGWENSTGAKAEKGVLDWKGAQRLFWSITHEEFRNYINPSWETARYSRDQLFAHQKPAGTVGDRGEPGETGPPGWSEDRMNPKDKLGMKKPPLHLIPASALVYLSRVMALGAKKYGPGNWRKHPVKMTVYLSAAWRHILEALDGLDKDDESGMPPMAHAMACCAIILDAQACGCLIDDRPPKGAAHKLIAELTEKNEPNFASVAATCAEMKKAIDRHFEG